MINLLVIDASPDAADRFGNLLPPPKFKVTVRHSLSECRTLIESRVFDIGLLVGEDEEGSIADIGWTRKNCPFFPFAAVNPSDSTRWEESALRAGAHYVFREPIIPSHLEAILRNLTQLDLQPPENAAAEMAVPSHQPSGGRQPITRAALEVLRDFSRVLGYSLDYKLFTEHFVARMREILSVNRIAIFLETPSIMTLAGTGNSQRLPCVSAVGIAQDIRDCFELSRNAGIGYRLSKSQQILRAHTHGGPIPQGTDPKVQREFQVLGCQIAIPINDRERTIGVAVLGDKVTGSEFSEEELQLLFLLMEELGLAIRNSWLHHQLAASHRLFSDVLSSMSNGSMVVGPDLSIIHANRAMLQFFGGKSKTSLEFPDLPGKLAAPIYDVVEKGIETEAFYFTGGPKNERIFRVSLIPFRNDGKKLPQSVMVVAEDFTQIEAAKRYDIEASKAKLIALIAKRFAHEIRNSLVPLTTHQQLLDVEYDNEDFRVSLKNALEKETGRIQRFTEQMLFLSHNDTGTKEVLGLRGLVEEAFSQINQAGPEPVDLRVNTGESEPVVEGNRHALQHAFQEIFLNAVQANPDHPEIDLTIEPDGTTVIVHATDGGSGFTRETAQRAAEPFYTTRNTGVGLGLTVAKKIVEDHGGTLEIAPRSKDHPYDIAIILPVFGA